MALLKRFTPPGYILVCTMKPTVTLEQMTDFVVDGISKVIYAGGIVRKVYNHGVGPTPYKMRTEQQDGRLLDARVISLSIYVKPKDLKKVNKEVRRDDKVMRYTCLRETN